MTSLIKMSDLKLTEIIGKGYNEFWHSKHFYRVVKGSRGSKKSKTTALNLIYRLMRYDWANILVIRRFSNTNKQSTFTDLKWAINRLQVDVFFILTRACQRSHTSRQVKRYFSGDWTTR